MIEAHAVPEMAKFSIEFLSEQMAVREALSDVQQSLRPLDLGEEDLGTVQIVLAEVLNNIVEHAYPDPATPGPIKVECEKIEAGLGICVLDQGKPMPDGQTPAGLEANLDVDLMDLPEGGFGWFLIQNLTKDVHYERQDSQNTLNFWIPIG